MKAIGINGQVEFDGEKVVILRKGIVAFFADPVKGGKTIPVSSLTSIEFKAARIMYSGYIRFAFQGGMASNAGWSFKDDNSVVFNKGNLPEFEAIREAVEKAMLQVRSGVSSPISIADELKKLAELRDSDVITSGQFEVQKARLLA
jgi:hypothetical protein